MSPEVNLPAGPHIAGGELAAASSETQFLFGARTYRAFISYSHADSAWARWLVRRLENFKVPERFHGMKAPIGKVGAHIAPVFRDRDELPTTSDLGETIRTALRQSATLVVICSPASAKSRWVQEEIIAFKRMGGSARVFAFIVGGEPKAAGTSEDCFSPALRAELGADGNLSANPAEHVAADARPQGDGKEDALVRLVSGLLGVGFDELRQREQQRRLRRLTVIATCSALGMAITLGLAAMAWQARNDAQRRQERGEDLLAFMLGDQRTQLKKLGRLDVLDAVGEKAISYFASLDERDLTDTALARQAQALRQIGENRMDQLRYPEAVRAFTAAFGRAAALAARHPGNGEILFERGQAEYWIGFVHWKRRDLAAAREWFTRYRATATFLVSMDPAKLGWQGELAYGNHNLAVLEFDEGKLDVAKGAFRAELISLNKMIPASPKDLELQFRVADATSWLGSIAERTGELAESLARFSDQVRLTESILRSDPTTARWKARLADALVLHASMLALVGRRDEAMAERVRAKTMMDALVATDPQNRARLRAALILRLKEARLLRADHDPEAAAKLIGETCEKLEVLAAAEPTDRDLAGKLFSACCLRSELLAELGRAGADIAIARAVGIAERLVGEGRANEEILGEAASTQVVAGRIAEAGGDHAAALAHWRRAIDLLGPAPAQSAYWRILDPTARALACLGERERSEVLIERLQRMGYRPLEPWSVPSFPTSTAPANPKS